MAGEFDDFPIAKKAAPGLSVGSGEFDEFPLADAGPSPGRAFLEQAIGGLTQGSAIAGGAVMGAGIGGATPLGPVGALAGGVIGAGAGYMFGEGAKGLAGIPDIESLPQDVRPAAVAGETIGQALPFGGATVGLARAGVRAAAPGIGTFINRILDYAGKAPRAFMAAEAGAAAAAGVAGGVAEAYFPGDPWARFSAEVGAGFLSPTRLFSNAASTAGSAVTRLVKQMAPAGRENRAAQILQDAVRLGGDDPQMVAAILSQPDALGLALTTGPKSGSATLAALEASLAEGSAKFGAEQKKVAESALASLRNMAEALRGTGDPRALAQAAELRAMHVRSLIQGRVQLVEADAVRAAKAISGDEPRDRAELSVMAGKMLTDSLKEMREVERSLWDTVPKLKTIEVKGIMQAYGRLRTEMLPEEKLPPIVEEFVSRMRTEKLLTDSGEVIRFRSRALSLAREAAGQGRLADARAFGQLAEAALDDLGQLRQFGDSYDLARTFSRELHDVYTRSFGGDALAKDTTGALRIPPEMLMERAMGAGGTGADVRLQDLENLAGFLTRQGLSSPEATNRFGQMLQAQERIIALAAADATDAATGRPNINKLSNFLRKNQGLLDRFPEVRDRIEDAIAMETRAQRVAESAKRGMKAIEKGAAFSRIENVESAVDAIRSAARGNAPGADLAAIARLAKRGGGPAVQGLRSAVIEHALDKAEDAKGAFSFIKFKAALDEPVKPGAPSLASVMETEGVLDAATRARMTEIVDKAVAIERSMRGGASVEELLKSNPDALTEIVIRITGAKIGTAAASAAGGGNHGLIAAAAGSKFMTKALERVDRVTVMKLLRDAMANPKLAATLLERPTSQAAQIRLARNIHAYLLSASVNLAGGGEQSSP